MRISAREDAPANASASFEDDHFATGFTEIPGSGETSRACADHENCLGIQAWLRLSTCFVGGAKNYSAIDVLSRFTGREMARRFVGDDAQTVASFTSEAMHQPARVFVRQPARFTAALADY